MLGFIFSVIVIIAVAIINIAIILFATFLMRIDVVNSACISIFCGVYLYLGNRHIDAFYNGTVHPALCLIIGIAILLFTLFLQKTKVGFWIFAVIFSIVWAFVSGLLIYILVAPNMTYFWIVSILAFIASIAAHKRAKDFTLSETVI